jgi:large subunit ribosomal protein L1
MKEDIVNAIKELKEKSKKRNFPQTFDLVITLKELDMKKPESKFSENFLLPHGRGKNAEVVVFSDRAKDADCKVLGNEDLKKITGNKRESKNLVSNTEFFLAEPALMPVVGKALGQFLAPRGKMPTPVTDDIKTVVEGLKKSVKIRVKDAPVIQCMIGKEDMEDEKVAENADAVLKFLETKLPKGKRNIGKVMLKLTMSKPRKIGGKSG